MDHTIVAQSEIGSVTIGPPLRREPFVDGATFGASGAYERVEGVAFGALDPTHPANRGIALLDRAPRNADGLVEYRSSYILLRPADPTLGNGRLIYEVNNRGRIMMLANLCAGVAGNEPKTAADLGNALPFRLGYSLLWTGWDPAAPKSTGLWLEAPAIENLTMPIRDEFVSGTRLGIHETFRLSHEATHVVSVTVRRTQTAERVPVPFVAVDSRNSLRGDQSARSRHWLRRDPRHIEPHPRQWRRIRRAPHYSCPGLWNFSGRSLLKRFYSPGI